MSTFYWNSRWEHFLKENQYLNFKQLNRFFALCACKAILPKSIWKFCTFCQMTVKPLVKIILHRIISAVWLTDFLSEIRSLINPRWWGKHLFLSVKRYSCPIMYWNWTHWWSLAPCLVLGADGRAAVWVVNDFLVLVIWSFYPSQ